MQACPAPCAQLTRGDSHTPTTLLGGMQAPRRLAAAGSSRSCSSPGQAWPAASCRRWAGSTRRPQQRRAQLATQAAAGASESAGTDEPGVPRPAVGTVFTQQFGEQQQQAAHVHAGGVHAGTHLGRDTHCHRRRRTRQIRAVWRARDTLCDTSADVAEGVAFPLDVPILPFAVEEVMLPGEASSGHGAPRAAAAAVGGGAGVLAAAPRSPHARPQPTWRPAGSVKTLHLFEARYISLLEEVLASGRANKLFVHAVVEQQGGGPIEAKAAGFPGACAVGGVVLLMGCLVRVSEQFGAAGQAGAHCAAAPCCTALAALPLLLQLLL